MILILMRVSLPSKLRKIIINKQNPKREREETHICTLTQSYILMQYYGKLQ